MPRHFAAILLSLVAVSAARADWLNFAVSNSPSGPFGPTANLWTQGPLTVDLTAETGPQQVFTSNVNAYVPIGFLTANFGSSEGPPATFPQMPFAFRVQGKLILSGQLSVLSNGDINFANVTSSDKSFTISLVSQPRGGAAESPNDPPPPGWSPFIEVESEIYAVVPLDELAQTPEPSALVLAGIGALIFGAVRRRVF